MKYIIYRFPDVLAFDDDNIHSGTRKEKCFDPHLNPHVRTFDTTINETVQTTGY